MLEISHTQEVLYERIEQFIWDFKVGDNIRYNLDVLFQLIGAHNNGGRFCKPISILAVSVIEAIVVDLISRLKTATSHYPRDPKLVERRSEIKHFLDNQTQNRIIVQEGEEVIYRGLKNFGYSDLVEISERFKLFDDNAETYIFLGNIGKFRNRVHINNYFKNFEKDEAQVFTERRTQRILDFMIKTVDIFTERYNRSWR